MILDALDRLPNYAALHPQVLAAAEFLTHPGLTDLPPGRHDIASDDAFAIIAQDPGKAPDDALLEVHNAHWDIQLLLTGSELLGWKPRAACHRPTQPYDAETDLQFFHDAPDLWLPLQPLQWVMFFPQDAHAPMIGDGMIHKVVVKLKVR